MGRNGSGFNLPVGEMMDTAKKVISEAGQTIRGHQDNKTKRCLSANDTGVKHHEIDSMDFGRRLDFVIRGFDTLIHGVESIGRTVNESGRIKADLAKTLEQEATKRDLALKELEKSRSSFEQAQNQMRARYENWQKTYQTAVNGFQSAWDALFTLVQFDGISEKDRENYQAQMLDLQKNIKETTIAFFEQDSVK